MPGEKLTDMCYPIHPEGLYKSLMQVGKAARGGLPEPLHPSTWGAHLGRGELDWADASWSHGVSRPRPHPHACVPQASRYRMPIYITETGIADRTDANRAEMIDSYMQAVRAQGGRVCCKPSRRLPPQPAVDCQPTATAAALQTLRAMKDGADVRGLYYWTLVDCFDWNAGYLVEFGLYAWRPDGSVDRVLKEGAKTLVDAPGGVEWGGGGGRGLLGA